MRAFTDREMRLLIEEGQIQVTDPSAFTGNEWFRYVQPGTMDLVLDGIPHSDVYPTLEHIGKVQFADHHPDLDDSFITFWPGHLTNVEQRYLKGWNHNALAPALEIRSTLRRIGLDTGMDVWNFGGGLSFDILNPRSYPISVQKGSSFVQAQWIEHRYPRYDGKAYICFNEGEQPLDEHRATGFPITSAYAIHELRERGELFLGDGVNVEEDGMLVFHAQKEGIRSASQHIILRADGKKEGLETRTVESKEHTLLPGEFMGVAVEEIGCSKRVGLSFFYDRFQGRLAPTVKEHASRVLTTSLRGGWIDPGYPDPTQVKPGKMYVQPIAVQEPLTITEGMPIALGRAWYYPQGVELPYGVPERESHYVNTKTMV